jgi:hypothetical protein
MRRGLRPRMSARKRLDTRPRQNLPKRKQSEAPFRRKLSVAIARATTWPPASSSVGIAVVANVSASAMDRQHRSRRRKSRRSRSRFLPIKTRGQAVQRSSASEHFRADHLSTENEPRTPDSESRALDNCLGLQTIFTRCFKLALPARKDSHYQAPNDRGKTP